MAKAAKQTIEKLIAAHTLARRRLAKAAEASRKKPLYHGSIELPELLGERTVRSHSEIDDRCNAYIAEAKQKGRFAARHHCTDSRSIMSAPPIEGRRFSRESLKEYRTRVKAHHARLDKAAAEIEEFNVTVGARALRDREDAAMRQSRVAWHAFRQAMPKMSTGDIARFANYTLRYTSNELDVALRLYFDGRIDIARLLNTDARDALRWISETLRPARYRRGSRQ
jgi:hypothetical protein